MSEDSKKKEKEVTITLTIKKSLYDSIVKQFETLKEKDIEGFSSVKNIEEFIVFYLKWLSNEGDHFKELESKMQDILNVLKDRGIDLLDELNMGSKIFKKINKPKKEEDEGEKKKEEKVQKKSFPDKVKKS
ncbi:hypothetical protein [Mycoplasma parvum]|uniref:Uncharacterized protein n=1 Tax=Mycoplasma parvum str. Indiana TaxID=1403316 RepID=U5NFN9_9MOLU|nr:hypothetical protein [Mycoplasma parvum]AGX89058.1 hypothetical protein PRV_01505 [Mycoplasma parvum str. Indiana]